MAARSYWRDTCAPIIAYVISTNPDSSESELRKLLREKYPFGKREMHPYKIWCSEVNNQLNRHFKRKNGKNKPDGTNPNQTSLFN